MRLLSLDPGGTTGYAVMEYTSEDVRLVESGQISDGLEGFISEWREGQRYDAIVCEDFILRPSVKFPDLSPVYIIGALEVLARAYQITYQPPSSKPMCTDTVLKRLKMYQVGKPHANDAIRHAIIYLRKRKHMPTLLAGWPKED